MTNCKIVYQTEIVARVIINRGVLKEGEIYKVTSEWHDGCIASASEKNIATGEAIKLSILNPGFVSFADSAPEQVTAIAGQKLELGRPVRFERGQDGGPPLVFRANDGKQVK
jgi:hypothetical protein